MFQASVPKRATTHAVNRLSHYKSAEKSLLPTVERYIATRDAFELRRYSCLFPSAACRLSLFAHSPKP